VNTWRIYPQVTAGERNPEHGNAMRTADGRCTAFPFRASERCSAKPDVVVEYHDAHNRAKYAAVCDACRRRCFGKIASEKRADTLAFQARQVPAVDIGPPGEPWKPKVSRR
jgi:hypothetical protein